MAKRYLEKEYKEIIIQFLGGQCFRCRKMFNIEGVNDLQIDHIVSLSKGGRNHISNIQILCASCHYEKSALERKIKYNENKNQRQLRESIQRIDSFIN